MTDLVLPLTFVAGLVTAAVAAIGSRALMNFSHRQLEVLCRAVHRRERFGQILDHHDEVAWAVEILESLGLILLISSGTLLWLEWLAGATLWAVVAWFAIGAVFLFAVTSWLPWAITRQCAAPLLLRTWWFWRIVHRVFWPLSLGMHFMDALVRRLAGNPERLEREEEEEAFEDEIMTMVTAGERDGLLESDARDMIEGVMELGDADVSDIMTPRSRVDAIDIRMGWPEILEIVVRSGRTRLPVYENTLDHVVGLLYVKDLLPDLARLPHEPQRSLADLLREPRLIPDTMPLDDLLRDFRSTRNHLAIVVDEYETVVGVVTIEDVLEEIVGEIVDESDKEEEDGIRVLGPASFEVLGTLHVELVNERLGLELPETDDSDTLAGFVVSRLGYIPQRGEYIDFGDARITVLDAQPRVVERLLIETPRRAGSPPASTNATQCQQR